MKKGQCFLLPLFSNCYLMKKFYLYYLLLLGSASAQFKVSGKITELRSGNSLPGANVVLSGTNLGAAADADGYFEINNVPSGTYELMATFIGYESYKTTLNINSDQVASFQSMVIKLSVSAIQLQEYVVTASRGKREKITDAPAAMSVISELKIRSESNPNLGDYFKNIKGVDFTASGMDSYNLSARGFNSSFSSRLLTLTDGRMANVPSLRLIAYNTIPLSSDDVSQIEVVLGPSSALYGPNAHSGVVNIITKRPNESLGTVVGYTTGSREFNKAQVRHAGKFNNFSYKVSAVNFTAHDWEYIEDDEKKEHYRQWREDGLDGEDLDDLFEDGRASWDGWDIKVDYDGDGIIDTVYLKADNIIRDANKDKIDDLPNFDIKNQRMDFRLDYDFSDDHFVSLNFGHAKATNINITGIGRYLANDWIYNFYQGRWIYKNWFAQAYLNTSNSGTTRNLRNGTIIRDESQFFHFQFQHSLELERLMNTQLVWGGDYQRTMPETFGTILPDGTGGRNPISNKRDGKDNDGDGEIDEWDELFVTNEFGLYAQSQTKLNSYLELVLAGRIDLHSGLTDDEKGFSFLNDPLDGSSANYIPQVSPKIGLLFKPTENHTFRLTSAKAFNTPSSQGLYLDVKAAQYSIFSVMARGNADGYSFFRDSLDNLMYWDVRANSKTEFQLAKLPQGAMLYIPAVLGRPGKEVSADDYRSISEIESETVWTHEFGYSGIVSDMFRVTFDLYNSTYSSFVSDLTFITPVVLDTSQSGWYGIDNPDPEIMGVVPAMQQSNYVDGGDGVVGSRYIPYGSAEWEDILALTVLAGVNGEQTNIWQLSQAQRQGSWMDVDQNGDTLGAYVTDDKWPISPPIIFTNINYGRVNLWGMDASIYAFLSKNITLDLNFSYIGKDKFYNRLTRDYDPVNAPKFKVNGKVSYIAEKGLFGNLGARYIPEFDWSAGVHYGTIESYFVIDGMLGYRFNEQYDLLLNLNNINNDLHREIIGGPKLGTQFTLKLNAKF